MHWTKAEIVQTQILVTTPKMGRCHPKDTGDTELVQKVRLLIIDEVHMLHDSRGAVLESLVARTERQVEKHSISKLDRWTVCNTPNYIESQTFSSHRMAGLFYLSIIPTSSLEQHLSESRELDLSRAMRTCRKSPSRKSPIASAWP